jgi:putative ABC transport system permease protein
VPVIAFVADITLTASILPGVPRALRAAAVQVSAALRDGGRSATPGRESQAARGLLVVAQVALPLMRLCLLQAWSLAGAGILLGLAVASFATRLLTSLLFEVAAFDILTFVIAPAIFLGVATLACLIPASRAAAADPAVALRRA